MEEKIRQTGREDFNISVQEFDALQEPHAFSQTYQKNKKRMLKKYRLEVYRSVWSGWAKGAAVFFLAVLTPAIISVAAKGEFWGRIWGTLGRENIEPHDEILYEEKKGTICTVTYPKREFTDEGLDQAEALLGDAISLTPLSRQIGDTTLTVLAAVYDGNAAVVEFTLKGEGVRGLVFDRLSNESKGAWFGEDAPFSLSFAGCSENIYVDMEKSTEEMVYCYTYLSASLPKQEAPGLTLEICRNTDNETEGTVKTDSLFIPVREELEKMEYVNAREGSVHISPISMDVDCNVGLGLTPEESYDPWNIYYAAIRYRDGTVYVVYEHGMDGIHPCEADVDNTGYVCGTLENHLVFVFNRLVDMENVECILVNEEVYTRQG